MRLLRRRQMAEPSPPRGWRRGQRRTRAGWKATALVTLVAMVTSFLTPTLAWAQELGNAPPSVPSGAMPPPSDVDMAWTPQALGQAPRDIGVDDDASTLSVRTDLAPEITQADSVRDPALHQTGQDAYQVDRSQRLDGTEPLSSDQMSTEASRETFMDYSGNPTTTELPTGEDKSGVTSEAISVPDGSATIQGMEESFSSQLSTGIATFTVPFSLPAARGAVQPSLSLTYSSAGGFEEAGVGWDLPVPFIARETDRGIPTYDDRDEWHPNQDRFVFNGGQELVPICTVTDGVCDGALTTQDGAPEDEVMPSWAEGHQYFRPRVEGSFLRFFWSPDHLTWRVQDKSGTTMELGVPLDGSGDVNGLEVNPDNTNEIYRWRLVRQYDVHGYANPATAGENPTPFNVVVYKYFQDAGMAYLSDIFDTSPAANPTTTDTSQFAHHTRVRWEPRSDETKSYRSGWLMEQRLRVQGVDVTSKTFAAPTDPRRLVRRYHVGYDPESHVSLLESVQVEGRCAETEENAVAEQGNGKLPATDCGLLPPMTFGYQRTEGNKTLAGYEAFNEEVHAIQGSPPHSIDDQLTEYFDINSDSLPDVLVTSPGLYSDNQAFFQNGPRGAVDAFSEAKTLGLAGVLGANANTIKLSNLNLVPLDVDGDGRINLLHMPKVQTYAIYSAERDSDGWFWQGREITTASGQDVKIDFGSDTLDTQRVDVNFDGLVDIVVSTGTEFQTFLSLGQYPGGDGQFGSARFSAWDQSNISNEPITTCVPHSGSPVRFSDRDTQLGDMNGDGISDIVRVRRGEIRYWPGRGNGYWGTGRRDDCASGEFGTGRSVEMSDSPWYSDVEGTTLRLEDVNGDGLTDMVQVRHDAVDVFLNVNGEGWTDRHIIDGTPASPAFANRVRLVDVNGSGTRDIMWGDGGDYKYIDLSGGKRPWILTHVDNGLGKTTDLEYTTSAQEMLRAETNGECPAALREAANEPVGYAPTDYGSTDPWSIGWCKKMPTIAHVVKRVTESDNITVAGRPPAQYVTEYEYRDPVFEGRQREFRGFERARARRIGDENSPTDFAESVFLLGECVDETDDGVADCSVGERWRDNRAEALKGLPVVNEAYDENGVYLSGSFSSYTLRTLYTGLDGRVVRHAFVSQTDAVSYDTAPFTPSSGSSVSITPVTVETSAGDLVVASSASPTLRSNAYAQIQSNNEVDAYGNRTRALAHGCVAGNECPNGSDTGIAEDETITTVTDPVRIAAHDGGWLWRTELQYVKGADEVQRNHTTTVFDDVGQPIETYVLLADSLASMQRFTGIAPVGASSDGSILTSTTKYDPFGNPTIVRGANLQCGRVRYDGDSGDPNGPGSGAYNGGFAQLPLKQTLYPKNQTTEGEACDGSYELYTVGVYDRGLGTVAVAMDFNAAPTRAEHDEFGRTVRLFRPHPNGGNSTVPSLTIQYHLPQADPDAAGADDLPTGTRYSVIRTLSEDAPSPDHNDSEANYLQSVAYVDGFGRTIVTLAEAEPEEGGTGTPHWIVGSLLDYDSKSAVRRKHIEFFWEGEYLDYAFETTPTTAYGSQRYDAFGRQVQTFDLDGTVTLQSRYHALGTDMWDAADLETGSHHNSFASERKDGHGRTIQATERFRQGGAMEERHVRTQYLATGEPKIITRYREGSDPVTRWMRYDTLGRMVLNVEPNTTENYTDDIGVDPDGSTPLQTWRYAYDNSGNLVGTTDARGCGQNFYYDSASRLIAEDYLRCEDQHAPHSPVTNVGDVNSVTGAEVYYLYDIGTGIDAAPADHDGSFALGRTVAVFDRARKSFPTYDARGRITQTDVAVATPDGGDAVFANRYAPRWYTKTMGYDSADRDVAAATGLDATSVDSELMGDDGNSTITTTYSARGTVSQVGGSYGDLVTGIVRTADGRTERIAYGDAAETRTDYSYDQRRRLSSVQTYRGPPAIWDGTYSSLPPPDTNDPTTFQLLLQDEDFIYDVVGNPTEIRDWRNPDEWPAGAKPVTRKVQYDDLYRASRVDYQCSAGDDEWKSPFEHENQTSDADLDPRLARPAPHQHFDNRVRYQAFEYDWLGNTARTSDDANGFYDRSLGTIRNAVAEGKPYQLDVAEQTASPGGNLSTDYDAAGNLTRLNVTRNGECLPANSGCDQVYHYEWDEVGRLVRARRYDDIDQTLPTNLLPPSPAADLQYVYDAADQRVIKRSDLGGEDYRHTLYVFDSLELRRSAFDDASEDYQYDEDTAVPYLFANGMRIARVMWEFEELPRVEAGQAHVFFELGDHLGSTSVVLDKATGELVQRSTFQAFGGTESDYRPSRWAGFREDYRFTGKEEDVEVGLQYFGKRYLNPLLGRWVSADPLAVQVPGEADWNLYAYVSGAILKSVDPFGLDIVFAQRLNKAEVKELMGQLRKLTNDKLKVERQGKGGPLKVTIAKKGSTTEGKVAGTQLVRDLANAKGRKLVLDIVRDDEATGLAISTATPKGKDMHVKLETKAKTRVQVKQPGSPYVQEEKSPVHISLGHELIHGQRHFKGRTAYGDFTYRYLDSKGRQWEHTTSREEAETVGLARAPKDVTTENALRREQGYYSRATYYSPDTIEELQGPKRVPGEGEFPEIMDDPPREGESKKR